MVGVEVVRDVAIVAEGKPDVGLGGEEEILNAEGVDGGGDVEGLGVGDFLIPDDVIVEFFIRVVIFVCTVAEPGMGQDLWDRQPLLGIELQESFDQRACLYASSSPVPSDSATG